MTKRAANAAWQARKPRSTPGISWCGCSRDARSPSGQARESESLRAFWGTSPAGGSGDGEGGAPSPILARVSMFRRERLDAFPLPRAGRGEEEEEETRIFLNERLPPHPPTPPGSRLPPATRRWRFEAQPVSIATALIRGSSE